MYRKMVNASDLFVQLFLPQTCIVCGVAGCSPPTIDLCRDCSAALPANSHCCSICADGLPAGAPSNAICGQCLQKKPKFNAAFCAYRYAYPIDHLIRDFKFRGRLAYGRVLGEVLADSLLNIRMGPLPSLLLPVPLAD